MSTYIRIFYEENQEIFGWESMHVFNGYKEYYKKISKSVLGIIRHTSTIQLGFLTTIFLKGTDIVFLLISISLFFLAVILNIEYNKSYDDEWEVIMLKYRYSLKKSIK